MAASSESDFEDTPRRVRIPERFRRDNDVNIDEELGEMRDLTSVGPSRVYMITYARCSKVLFPTRKAFGDACVQAFGGTTKVTHFACAEELHEDGTPHYHVTLQLKSPERWGKPKKRLMEMGATVHFSEGPQNTRSGKYGWAFRYICKVDRDVYTSKAHPTLRKIVDNSQKTAAATAARAEKRRQSDAGTSGVASEPVPKVTCMTNVALSNYVREENIQNMDQLLADAEKRREAGDYTLSAFILGRSLKCTMEVLTTTWKMKAAVEKVRRREMPRMTCLRDAAELQCVCDGQWLAAALEILHNNEINKYMFAYQLRELLGKGRAKDRNLFLVGPGNSGKTFLLKPLLQIYPDHFTNPAASKFAWLGVTEASIILLNDYRWHSTSNKGNIEWGMLLSLLDGMECNLPAPMNHYNEHIKISIENDVPIFGTGPTMIKWYSAHPNEPRGADHDSEDNQILSRWKIITLTERITSPRDITSCASCFAKMALLGED